MTGDNTLSVRQLFEAKAAGAAARRAEEEAAAARRQAEIADFTRRVMAYQITEDDKDRARLKIRRAFENGEREAMLVSFPCDVCTDGGRRINNGLDGWVDTLPGALRHVHDWWETELKPGGFTFAARTISYPGGMPGDIGLFIGWPDRID